MMMVGRKFGGICRYGFNGKEQDSEIKGTGAQYDYGFRIYDPRVGRFLSVDPLTNSYPELTPYQFSGNSPITFIDLDGLELAWKNPVTGETKAAGPVTLPIGSKNSDGWILFMPPMKKEGAVSVPDPPIFKPALQSGSDNLASIKAEQSKQIALKQATSTPKPMAPQNVTTVSAYNPTEYDKQKSAERAKQDNQYKYLQSATIDPFAAHVVLSTYLTAQTYTNNVVQQGKIIVENVQDGKYLAAAGNVALLALDASPFLLKGSTTAVTSNIPARLARIIPEEYAGTPTLGAKGALDVFVTDANAIRGITNSTDLARKLTLKDGNGNLIKGPFRVIEFDTPSSGLASPLNRTNPGFIGGGNTAGGAPEYILPNLQVSDLKNVLQTTIK